MACLPIAEDKSNPGGRKGSQARRGHTIVRRSLTILFREIRSSAISSHTNQLHYYVRFYQKGKEYKIAMNSLPFLLPQKYTKTM